MKSLWNDLTSTAAIRTAIVCVLALLALFLLAQSVATIKNVKDATALNSITVSGEGTATALPDTATVSFGSSATGQDVAIAQSKVTAIITNALASVKASGVAEEDITTTSYNVSPHYNTPICQPGIICLPNSNPTISGYDVSEEVSVKIHDTKKVSDILAGLAKANVSNVSGPQFIVGDTQAVETTAQVNAIKKAEENAQKIAQQLHVNLGRVESYSDNSSYGNTSSMDAAPSSMMSAKAAPPVVPVGQNTYTKDISITYEIH